MLKGRKVFTQYYEGGIVIWYRTKEGEMYSKTIIF